MKSLGVVGVGVLGCSIALRFREVFPDAEVVGLDTQAAHLDTARAAGALTSVASDFLALVQHVDILVLATPIASIVEMLGILAARNDDHAGPRLIIDVASVKSVVHDAGRGVKHFVATHPMAGSHTSGPAAAQAALFSGRPWAYVAGEDLEAISMVKNFIHCMGARAVAVDARIHDALVARTSHLPQALSTLLALHALREPVEGLYGQGLLDMLRLAHSSDAVWNDIYIANRESVTFEIDGFIARLQAFREALHRSDRAALRESFEQANILAAQVFPP